MNSLRCSNCSLLNFDTATACKRCGLPFNSEAEAGIGAQHYAPAESYSQQSYQQPAEGGSHFWDQPNYQPNYIPPPPPPSSSGGMKVVGILVSVAVAALVAFVAMPKLLKSGKANLSNITWSEYQSPDGSYSVSMPATPKETQMNHTNAAGTAQVRVVTAEIGRDAGCMVMYADYPVLSKVSEDTLYEQTIKAWASKDAAQYAIGQRKFITQDGHRGLEVEFKPPILERMEAKGRMRLFWVAPRLYMVMSAGPETPEFAKVSDRCLDSFKFSTGR
jgi:hypothetical protein